MDTKAVAPIGYNQKLKANEKRCAVCGRRFRRRGQRKFTAKYCSLKCKGRGLAEAYKRTGVLPFDPRARKTGKEIACAVCGKAFYSPACVLREGRKFCSRKCYYKVIGENCRGEKHWAWKGGVRHRNQVLRGSGRYLRWRYKVFGRDDFRCRRCRKRGGQLEAHHIKSWADYPSRRFWVSNGMTLCKDCHKKTDNYKRIRRI